MYYPQDMDIPGGKQNLKKQSKSTERANAKIKPLTNPKKVADQQQILDQISKAQSLNSQIDQVQTVKTSKSFNFNNDLPSSTDGDAQRQTGLGIGERGSTDCPNVYNQSKNLHENSNRIAPMNPASGDIDGENDNNNMLDPYSNQSVEYYLEEEQASREAYFGDGQNQPVQPHSGTSGSFQWHARGGDATQLTKLKDMKRNTASMPYRGADSNLNLASPAHKALNAKSAKNTTKTQRKREGSKITFKGQSGLQTKTQRKKINELGTVYDSKAMMVPAINGTMVRTSTQELRAMNGFSVAQQHGKAQNKNSAAMGHQRKVTEEQIIKKRGVSQSPSISVAYKTPKMNQLVASNLPAAQYAGMMADQTNYEANREGLPPTNENVKDYLKNSISHQMLDKNGSISARSAEKNSLPEICNRSVTDGGSFVVDQPTITHLNGDESDTTPFYPSPINDKKGAILASVQRHASRPDPSHDITISEDNIALASFNNQTSIDQASLTLVECNEENTKVGKRNSVINLPKIAAKQTQQKVNAQKQQNKLGSTVRSTKTNSQPLNGSNIYIQRTNNFAKGSTEMAKSPRVIRGAMATTGPGFTKRDMTRTKQLDPIKINEETNVDDKITSPKAAQPSSVQKQESYNSTTSAKQQRNSASQATEKQAALKPLNHTPVIVKKSQQNPLIPASKTFFKDQQQPQSSQNSAKMQADLRKTSHNLGQKRVSIHDSNLIQEEKPDRALALGLESSERKSVHSRTEEEKMQSITSGTKPRDRSPLRQANSVERVPGGLGLGGGLRKDNKSTAIIAQSYNAEPFYRRAMKKLNWSQIPQDDHSKANFHIRFNIGDLEGSSKDLQPKHFYNHFPTNRELVTKMGLCKNLWFNCFTEHEHRISHMFPRCYDLSVPQQAESFISDFNQTAILSIVKIMANHFMKRNKEMQKLLQEYEMKSLYEQPDRLFKPAFRKLCQRVDMRSSGVGNLLGISEVRDAYSYSKDYSNSLMFKEAKKVRKKKFNRASAVRISESQIQDMVKFQSKLVENGVPSAGFATYEQFKIVRLHKILEKFLPQYRQIDGTHNIWIVKPSYNARGLGIYCTRQLREILKDAEKTQQKVVQKYIERPFCIDGQKKFDFRQWVLVNNWEPLDVCVFSSAYLKVCGSEFDLKQIGDVYRHLSNYSIQKENGDKIDLVMSSSQFQEFMQGSQRPGMENFTWENDMLPKINDVVWRTLKSVQENIEQKSNCFEVYGFDIVLDQDLEPWVIEVNLSPACTERADWLTKMLDDSCIDLLKHIQSRILTANPAESWATEMLALREQAYLAPHKTTKNLNPRQFYEENQLTDRWIRLEESIQEIKDFMKVAYLNTVPQKGIQLEVVSEKADLRFERKLDRGYRQDSSAIEIQRVFRGYLGRKIYIAKLRTKCSIIIQKNVRTLLAKCELIRLRQKRAATIVQKQLRRILACRVRQELEAERILRLKTELVTKLQTRYRMAKAKAFVHSVRQEFASIRCQRYLRGFLQRRKAKLERTRKCLIVRLQRFYKRRFRLKNKQACLVQRLLKGRLARKKVLRLSLIAQGTTIIHQSYLKHMKKLHLQKLRYHAKAIKIQSIVRMLQMRRKYKTKLKEIAQNKLRKILRLNLLVKLKRFSANLRQIRDGHALTIQKRLKSYLAQKRLKRMKLTEYFNTNATVVKRFMKGYLGKKEAKRRRIKIGAAIMIQSLYRGFIVRNNLKMQLMWEQEQLEQKRWAKNKNAQRGSEMTQYSTKGHGRISSNAQYNNSMTNNINGSTGYSPRNNRLRNDDRSSRYMSNNPKFIGKHKGSTATRALVNKTGSQGSLRQSESRGSLALRSDEQAFTNTKFTSQQSGNKKRKIVKKGISKGDPKWAGGITREQQQHYELGLIHLYQNQQQPQSVAGAAQSHGQHKDSVNSQQQVAAAANKRNDKRYSLQRVYKMEQKQKAEAVQPPARLGSKIASNLNKQKVENLMSETGSGYHRNGNQVVAVNHQQRHIPKANRPSDNLIRQIANSGVKQSAAKNQQAQAINDDFDERLDRIIMETMNERETIEQQRQQQQKLVSIHASGGQKKNPKHLSIETKKSDCYLNNNASNASSILTPQIKGKAATSHNQSSDHKANNMSTNQLQTQRSGIFLKPIEGNVKVRQSFEKNQQLEQHLEPQVVAQGLGKDQNVKAISTTLNKSLTGKGVATTVVMRKDPSRGSLNSAREKQQSQVMDSNPQKTSQLLKQTKDKSKQIKTLEKLVQHGAAYMHPQARPAIKRNTTSMIREKISEQQQKQASVSRQAAQPEQNGTNKSFARYLTDMLENQARQGGLSTSSAGSKNPIVIQQESYRWQADGADNSKYLAFSSAGKNSMSGLRLHQPDFKPVKVQNGKMTLNNSGTQQTSFVSNDLNNLHSFNLDTNERVSPTNENHEEQDSNCFKEGEVDQSYNQMPDASIDSEAKKSEFAQKLEEAKYQQRGYAPQQSQKSYSQAMAVFNKTKNNYLNKIKKSQDKRVEAVNNAHQKSFNLLKKSNEPTGASVPVSIHGNHNHMVSAHEAAAQNVNKGYEVSTNRTQQQTYQSNDNKQSYQSRKSNSNTTRPNQSKLVVI